MDISKMTDAEIHRTWVWQPRLMMACSILFNKALKDVTNEELLEAKKYALKNKRNYE